MNGVVVGEESRREPGPGYSKPNCCAMLFIKFSFTNIAS